MRRPDRRRPVRRRTRRGQAAVFVALCLMALLLVVAYSTNVGIVTNDRIRMQETADLATYAVAYSEAASLNDVTKANQGIADAVSDCRSVMQHGRIPWATPCNCGTTDPFAEIALQVCRADIDAAIVHFTHTASYDRTIRPALQAGKATAEANFKGTGRHLTFFENTFGSPTRRGTYDTEYELNTAGIGGTFSSIADFTQVHDTEFNYQFMNFCGPDCAPSGVSTRTAVTMSTWFYKDNRDPEVWVAGRVAGTPEKRFLDTDFRGGGHDKGYFGASSTGGDDMLVAYAVAKPYDGSVGPSELSGYQVNGNWPEFPVYGTRGPGYAKLAMYDQYRARLAGIQDDLAGDTTPSILVQQDAATFGKSWDMSRFEH